MTTTFDLEAATRLPLADAALRLLDFVTEEQFLNGVFERHRGRSYEDTISFPLFVQLIADTLLGHRGSAYENIKQARQDKRLDTTVPAPYGKLRRVPLELSLGFFTEACTRLCEVGSPVVATPLPASLAEFQTLGFDGKKLKYVVKKLKPLRGLKGNIFGGKLLVAQDLATQQALAIEAALDGEAADNPLVGGVVQRVRQLPNGRPRLWTGDRAFCDFAILETLGDGDHYAIRYRRSFKFTVDSSQPTRTGIDDDGRPYQEQWGWLGQSKRRIYVRMITVTRQGRDALSIVTSLLDANRYPAVDLLSLYRRRWGIEVMFQRVVQVFDLRHLISAAPKATVFQGVLCFLLYNMTLVIRDYVAEAANQPPPHISLHLLFDDLVRELTGWMKVIGVDKTIDVLDATPVHGPRELRRCLQRVLKSAWTDRWLKAPTRKGRVKKPPHAYICGGHSSVAKIERGEHQEIPLDKKTKTKPFLTKKHV